MKVDAFAGAFAIKRKGTRNTLVFATAGTAS